LAPLPNTDAHITRLADLFSVDSKYLLFDLDASKSALKDPRVQSAQVIAFATHGLMANEVRTLAEPALVLHPNGDDGLLLASEIAELPLSAEWIVLSACNTAARQGETGAEGLSGLARSFFFAGSRSLLVSHWWIEAGSADFLARRTLEIWRGDRAITKAEALRRSMKERMGDLLTHSHPYYWAGFSVVGV
jgi:CHAT domain-containing protein